MRRGLLHPAGPHRTQRGVEQGKERVVGLLGPGSFIGEGCLGGQPVYLASARASTEATVIRVEAETMVQAIHEHPELSERFMAYLLLRNSQIESDLVDQLFNSSEKRLARLLIMLAQVGQEAELRTVVTPISQEVMAARVGTTRSRINYFMNKFRKLGLIEYNGAPQGAFLAAERDRARVGAGWHVMSSGPRASRAPHEIMSARDARSPEEHEVTHGGGYSASSASDELHHVLRADEVAAHHLGVRPHALQVLAGAHGVAEAALEGRLLGDRHGAGAAIAGDRHVGRLVHAQGGGEPQPHAQVDVERACGRGVVDLARRLMQEGARRREPRLEDRHLALDGVVARHRRWSRPGCAGRLATVDVGSSMRRAMPSVTLQKPLA